MRPVKITLVLPALDGKATMEKAIAAKEGTRLSELSYLLALTYPDCEMHDFEYRTSGDPL